MNLAWGARVSPGFRDGVVALCGRVGIADPSWLMACMAFETGRTFSPSVRNAVSGATGLIQFMPSTALGLGTTIEELAAKTAEEQVVDVEKYLHPYAGRLHTLSDVYMSILWPAAIGQSEAFPLFSQGPAYVQNRGLDVDNDHIVTKREATHYVINALAEGLQPENTAPAVPEAPPASATPPAAIHVPPTQGLPAMDPLSIIAIVGPLLKALLPQVGILFGGAKDAQNAKVIGTVLDTVVQAAGAAPAGATATLATAAAAVEKMQTEPTTLKAVQDAVLTHPDIAPLLTIVETGGGPAAAAERDLKVMGSDVPFWKTSAVFWVSMALLPMIYWYVGSSVVGGTMIPESWPWIAQMALKLFGPVWDPGARVGLANLIVGLVLGGICGVYYGISVTQQKQQATSTEKS